MERIEDGGVSLGLFVVFGGVGLSIEGVASPNIAALLILGAVIPILLVLLLLLRLETTEMPLLPLHQPLVVALGLYLGAVLVGVRCLVAADQQRCRLPQPVLCRLPLLALMNRLPRVNLA